MANILLEMRKVRKSFPGVLALMDVDFDVRQGEVHVLLGANGAGKSTLIKILSGVYPPDAGQIFLNGQEVRFESPGDSQRIGIRVIFQEPNLIPNMTVAENIHLGSEPSKMELLPVIDEKRLIAEVLDRFDELNLAVDPYALVSELSLAEQQVVAIARALHQSADLVIMDEPTAVLTQQEVSQLFSVIRKLRANGIGILYVTHRLEEAMQLGDRATILRDGRKIATLQINETTQDELIQLIAGRHLESTAHTAVSLGPEVLRLEHVSASNGVEDLTFDVRAGEILGVTGLMGAGGTSILRTIFGVDEITAGTVYVDGKPARIHAPQDAIALGIGLLTEDRQEQGLVLNMNAQENMTLASLSSMSPAQAINPDAEEKIAQHYAERLSIDEEDLARKTLFLSGGTQQKVVLSRWLASQCRVLLLDEPTQGIDVGARFELYRMFHELARRGIGMVVVSSNLSEILALSDRVAIVRNGHIVGIYPRDEISQAEILTIASGGSVS